MLLFSICLQPPNTMLCEQSYNSVVHLFNLPISDSADPIQRETTGQKLLSSELTRMSWYSISPQETPVAEDSKPKNVQDRLSRDIVSFRTKALTAAMLKPSLF